MPPYRRRYQYPQQNRFSDPDDIRPSSHEEGVEASFEEDHESIDGLEQEYTADPDFGQVTPLNQLHTYHPGRGFRPYRQRR
jgi:hypothetical protein